MNSYKALSIRGAGFSPQAYRLAFARIYLILHGGPRAAINASLRRLGLPLVGTQIPPLPPGEAREVAQTHCLGCHASEMILQQRLTETQWRSELDKMNRWGADVPDEDSGALFQYLVSRFGRDNDRFTPIVASPQQRPDAGPNGGAQ